MKALEGIKILDFTHIQSGPTSTQILAWLGAEVIKLEKPGTGDATRQQLVDIPEADSLYFTMLNHNKKSIELDTKHPKGKAVLTRLIEECDVMVENFAHGVLDRMGFSWAEIHKINPRIILASIKGFGAGPFEDTKVYENIAQCIGGSASTTGWLGDKPMVTAAQIGDSGTGLNLCIGILAALHQRARTGRGQKVSAAMQDGVLNLCRVKLRDQQRLAQGPLPEYSQAARGIEFGASTPRAGNDSGGAQPGRILKCRGWESDPDAYTYFVIQTLAWEKICDLINRPNWKTDPGYATLKARLANLDHVFETIEAWTITQTKFEVLEACRKFDIPNGPILSTKELIEDETLRARGVVVDLDHPTRGSYTSVGCPIELSDSPVEVKRSPLLGEHTDSILEDFLGYGGAELAEIKASGAVGKK